MLNDMTVMLMMEALSPITHMSGSEGNEAVLMREPVVSNGTLYSVPVLTGNAIRHRALRASGYLWMIARCEMDASLNTASANFLINGGSVSKSTRDADLKGYDLAKSLCPLLGVLGGCTPDQIIPGRVRVGRGVMACRENAGRIASMFPEWSDDLPTLRSSGDFISPYQYTRGEASKYVRVETKPEDTSNLMIFSGEQVIPGAVFFCRIRLRRPTELEAGAMLHALCHWDGTIGGQAARGHGQFDLSMHISESLDVPDLIAAYEDHIDNHKAEIAAWVQGVFA